MQNKHAPMLTQLCGKTLAPLVITPESLQAFKKKPDLYDSFLPTHCQELIAREIIDLKAIPVKILQGILVVLHQ